MFDSLTKRLSGIFSKIGKKGYLTESDVTEVLREVRVALLEADVNFQVAKQFIQDIKEQATGAQLFESLEADQPIIKIVKDELVKILGPTEVPFNWGSAPPTVVLLFGLQGSGKTTTASKLAMWMQKQGKKPMLAACDTQRPAAIAQLETLGKQIDVPVYAKTDGTSPSAIAREALERAKYLMRDVLIVDTAGRLTIDEPLMKELEEIERFTKPNERFIVLDASIGQEAVNVAKAFHDRFPLTGAIFTKLDGDTRGGAVLSVKAVTGTPVRFIGIGEQVEALDLFYPDRVAQRILGMGDILGLIEKVEQSVDAEDMSQMQNVFHSGKFTFNEMIQQIQMVRKLGSVKSLLKMVPGLSSKISDEQLNKINLDELKLTEAIIQSMTPKERSNPDLLNGPRKKRIARGAGTSVEEVNILIKRINEMQKNMKMFKSMSGKMKKYGKSR